MTVPPAIAFDRVSKTFPDGTRALSEVSFGVGAGEFCVVLGPSGSGKSTLLRTVNGLATPDAGMVYIGGVPLSARLHYRLGEYFVYGPLKNVMGFSRVRVAYTAGEAIGGDLFAFYRSIGLNLKQLYGQTEAFLYVTCQPDGAVRSDTVGPPAPSADTTSYGPRRVPGERLI